MRELTLRQQEFLLFFASRNRHDRTISEAAERFGVSKATVSIISNVLAEEGAITKNSFGEVVLTDPGWEKIRPQWDRLPSLTEWMEAGLGLEPLKAEREARRMVVSMELETVDAILRRWEARKPAFKKEDVLPELAEGRYFLDFQLRKKNSDSLSMGDRGFHKPAILEKQMKGGFVRLRTRLVHRSNVRRGPSEGSLENLWYRRGDSWIKTEKDGVEWRLPLEALYISDGPEGRTGTVRIRVRVTVGIIGMPESEADMLFFLDALERVKENTENKEARRAPGSEETI